MLLLSGVDVPGIDVQEPIMGVEAFLDIVNFNDRVCASALVGNVVSSMGKESGVPPGCLLAGIMI